MSHKVALWMYKAVLHPQYFFVSVVCCPMLRIIQATNLLRNLQISYLRAAVGSMKTTPTKAPYVALCLPPQYLAVIGVAIFTAD
jgi:hypothetical protein